MNVNPIGNPSEGKKTESAKNPTNGKFAEELRVKKTDAIDPDAKNKRKERALGSGKRPAPNSKKDPLPSIYDAKFSKANYGRPSPSEVPSSAPRLSDNESLPHSTGFWKRQRPQAKQERTETARQEPRKAVRNKDNAAPHDELPGKEQKKHSSSPSEKTDKPTAEEQIAAILGDLSTAPSVPSKKVAESPEKDRSENSLFDPDNPLSADGEETFSEDNPSAKTGDKNSKTIPTDMPEKKVLPAHEKKDSPKRKKTPTTAQLKREKHLEALAASFAPLQILTPSSKDQQIGQEISSPVPSLSITPAAVETASHVGRSSMPPELDNLFTQMVGTVLVMSEKGIARTEVVLNSPAFEGSRFFGSTLIFEKYATAPDSFNIQLLGKTPQQLDEFTTAIPNLYQAFSEGKFSFRIGRLESYYDPDRALFHRKDPSQGKDSSSDDSDHRRENER